MQIIYQDPFGSLDPRMTVGDIVGEPLMIHQPGKGKRRIRRPGRKPAGDVGLNPAMAVEVSPRVQRRSAAAHRHSPGAGGQAGLHRLRRAGIRPGCVDPGPDHQPPGRPAGKVQPHLPLHRPRPAVVRHISDRIAVMYLGEIVEIADRRRPVP